MDLLDAPLRNNYIFQYQPYQENELQLIEELQVLLKKHVVDGLLFCPLAIGQHIDHTICRAAVLKLYNEIPVLFYEDLPYARRIKHQQILQHIQLERKTEVRLTNHTEGLLGCSINKEQVVRLYRSQMNDEIAAEITEHLKDLEGERIWGEEKIINRFRQCWPNHAERPLDNN